MVKLILHVGPGKCGSTSIQKFFRDHDDPCEEKIRFVWLKPVQISQLNKRVLDDELLTTFTDLLLKDIQEYDALIISHEFLFSCPYAIKNICHLIRNIASEKYIVGYSRRQSNLIASAYSQWFFRIPSYVNSAINDLVNLGLDPIFFNGLERQFIACIVNDFYSSDPFSILSVLDWNQSYTNIIEIAKDSETVVKCGVLPGQLSAKSLIQDFCDQANLTLRKKLEITSRWIVANTSFNHDLIETLNIALTLGYEVPGPHEGNNFLQSITSKMNKEKPATSDFVHKLKAYIDTYYLDSNNQLCRTFGLDESYFYPSMQFSKSQILEEIQNENAKRTADPSIVIEKFRTLAAKMGEACFKVAEANQSMP